MQRKRKKRYNNIYKFYEDYIEIYDKNNNLLCFIDFDDYDKILEKYKKSIDKMGFLCYN